MMTARKIALMGATMAAIAVSILLTAHARADIASSAYPPGGPVGGVLAGALPNPTFAPGAVDFAAIRTLALAAVEMSEAEFAGWLERNSRRR